MVWISNTDLDLDTKNSIKGSGVLLSLNYFHVTKLAHVLYVNIDVAT